MCAGKTTKTRNNKFVTVVTASTMQYLTQHPDTHEEGRCSEGLSVVNSCRETPGPIPNPEAKPAHADGTATGRLWESKSPPTPNNKTKYYRSRRFTRPCSPTVFCVLHTLSKSLSHAQHSTTTSVLLFPAVLSWL